MTNYYPLAAQNEWQYKQKDGSSYTNKVTSANGNEFVMHNSAVNTSSSVRLDGNVLTTDAFEAGNFQKWLTNDAETGQTWEVTFKANGLDSILVMTVQEKGVDKEVEGKVYNKVLKIESESKIIMNGNLMALNYFTQYYYADGVGLILTTSSAGDQHSLISHSLNPV